MKVLCITDKSDRPETELFIRLAKETSEFAVMCNPEGRNYPLLVEAGVKTIPLKVQGRFDKVSTEKIKNELVKGGYDIAHAFNTRALACLLRAGKKLPVKLLAYRGVTTGVSYWKPESWTTFLSPRLDGIYCVSEAIRQSFLALPFFPERKVRTIYKGHDPKWYATEPVLPSRFGVPEGAPVLCCLSRNSAKKGIATLLDAFDQLPVDKNIHLVLVGSVAESAEVRKRVERCTHPNRILFTGYRDDAIAVIAGSSLLVSASESGEGLPRVVLEAMCVRTPVVATDAGGTRELVIDGETGLLVPVKQPQKLAEAIVVALVDKPLAKQRADNALERIRALFNPELTLSNTLRWYKDILAGS